MTDEPDERIQGVQVEELNDLLEAISYPITSEEFVSEHGDQEIERTNAEPITIGELFGQLEEDTYESPDEVRQMVLTMMPRESVGRAQYSDRGGSHPEETAEADRFDTDDSV